MSDVREFDATAIEEYRQFLQGLLDQLEAEVIPVIGEGALSRAPAFGSAPGATENALEQYLDFRAATWRNLQYLRGTLHGLIQALADTAGADMDGTDGDIAAMFEGFDASTTGLAEV
ncbi:hypothetical protein [Glycomyces buryatensis]|uniref:PE domain-containing protein n=1 Tax=Glycomyces buryatensis TaxID=2570927 RepID=A0A4S8QB74_9ACTN|nr:hypothetical protein [Glycomyces buryatensis]THV41520.1 hypothetical protein FAB82_10425 [Glycomyces buryatensis]